MGERYLFHGCFNRYFRGRENNGTGFSKIEITPIECGIYARVTKR
jgi:hypothetical protein